MWNLVRFYSPEAQTCHTMHYISTHEKQKQTRAQTRVLTPRRSVFIPCKVCMLDVSGGIRSTARLTLICSRRELPPYLPAPGADDEHAPSSGRLGPTHEACPWGDNNINPGHPRRAGPPPTHPPNIVTLPTRDTVEGWDPFE